MKSLFILAVFSVLLLQAYAQEDMNQNAVGDCSTCLCRHLTTSQCVPRIGSGGCPAGSNPDYAACPSVAAAHDICPCTNSSMPCRSCQNNRCYSMTASRRCPTGTANCIAIPGICSLVPTPSPTPSPTPPTPSPTQNPTPSPTESPTPSPTNEPTPSPTPNPSAAPTPSPTPLPGDAPSCWNCLCRQLNTNICRSRLLYGGCPAGTYVDSVNCPASAAIHDQCPCTNVDRPCKHILNNDCSAYTGNVCPVGSIYCTVVNQD